MHSPRAANGASIVRSPTPGDTLLVTGTVVDRQRHPIAGAEVDIWHASPVGLYENQDPHQVDMNLRGKFTTDADGRFWFSTVKMVGYPIPADGVVGRLLRAQGRHPFRPAHLHALISEAGVQGADLAGVRPGGSRTSIPMCNSASRGRSWATTFAMTSGILPMPPSRCPGIRWTTRS